MIQMVLVFLVVSACLFFGYRVFRSLDRSTKIQLTKGTALAIVCALLALVLLTVFVIAF